MENADSFFQFRELKRANKGVVVRQMNYLSIGNQGKQEWSTRMEVSAP